LPGSKAVFKDGSDNINGTFVGNITGNVTGNADTASAVAADNISAGDAAINLTTTSGNITIDAQGSDTDIILKGTDGSTDTNFLTFDGSSFGDATFSGTLRSPRGIETSSYFWMKTDGNTALFAGANFEVQLTHVHNTGFKLFNAGTGTPAVELQFNDANEAIGSDGTNLKLTSGGNEITVPNSGADTMTLNAATQTLTNKTLTSPKINEDVAVTATATEINKLDGVTATTTELNYVDVTTLGTVEASKAVTADANGDVLFPDNEVLQFGTGGDLKIFHNPNNSIIQESGSGSLFIDASDLNLRNGAGSATYATFADGGAVELNHNNVKKFETTSDGATVTGDLLISNSDADANADPTITLYRNSSSPAFDDEMGEIIFQGRNNNSENINYGRIVGKIALTTDGSEKGNIEFNVMESGTEATFVQMAFDNIFAYKQLTMFNNIFLDGNYSIIWDGATNNSNTTSLVVTDPTAVNTITLPDATGTVLTTGNSDTPTTTTSSSDADFVLVDDGGTMKKITPSNLGITSGGASKGFAVAMAIAL
jgi:hypothetical protein